MGGEVIGVPKPAARRKIRKPIPRGRPPKRSGRPKAKQRAPAERARIYGPSGYAAFVRRLPCVATVGEKPAFVLCTGPIEFAHTASGGTGRKADYTTGVPACRHHHRGGTVSMHAGIQTFERAYRVDTKAYAARIFTAWRILTGE